MTRSNLLHLGAALLMVSCVAACGDNAGGGPDGGPDVDAETPPSDANLTPPTVLSTTPADVATDVALNDSISATFSEPMDGASLTASTFTVTTGVAATPVAGTLIYADSTVVFWPSAHLGSDSAYTATVTTGAKSAAGVAMEAAHGWTFMTGTKIGAGHTVNLGAAGNYVILAKSAISTVPTAAVTGNIAVSPAAATYITGFSLTADKTNVFATSKQVTGKVYAASYAKPTPANLTTAVQDMQLAFTDAAGRAPDVTELGAGNIGGMTLVAGVYKWGTGLLIPTSITLTGSATDVWIFQVAQVLTVSGATNVTLAGNAMAKNVFWQVAGKVDLAAGAHLEGVVLSQTAITLHTGASINGRLMAQTAVSIAGSAVAQPAN